MLMLFVSNEHFLQRALQFWKNPKNMEQFPRLKIVHTKHHFIPATSAAMERVSSAAGYNAKRSRRADSTC